MSLFKKVKEARENKKGFTLVELIVVLVILAILAAILVPALTKWIDKSKEKQIVVDGRTVYLAAQTVVSEEYAKATPSITGGTAVLTINGAAGQATAAGQICDLAELDSKYTSCTVTVADWKITKVELSDGTLTATFDGASWTTTK